MDWGVVLGRSLSCGKVAVRLQLRPGLSLYRWHGSDRGWDWVLR